MATGYLDLVYYNPNTNSLICPINWLKITTIELGDLIYIGDL